MTTRHAPRRLSLPAGAVATMLAAGPALAQTPVFFPAPDIDSRTYPFTGQTSNAVEPVFGAYDIPEFIGAFDNRDSQVQLAFDTQTAGIPTGLSLPDYTVDTVTLTVTIGEIVGSPLYDPTYDPADTYPIANPVSPRQVDPDPGRPIPVFAAAFRNGYTGWEFAAAPVAGPPLFARSGEGYGPVSFGQGVRHVFPTDLVLEETSPGSGVFLPRDVSNNLDEPAGGTDQFDAQPLAVGSLPAVTPGDPLMIGDELIFEIDLTRPEVLEHVREGLARGDLGFVIATLLPASGNVGGGAGGDYVRLAMGSSATPPTLTVEYSLTPPTCEGDTNGDGATDVSDFFALASSFGDQSGADRADGDLTGDGAVDISDFFILAGDFGCTP